jgi:hypothetical protein
MVRKILAASLLLLALTTAVIWPVSHQRRPVPTLQAGRNGSLWIRAGRINFVHGVISFLKADDQQDPFGAIRM